ncbi:unnamed protein product [Cylicostephanus goldi]|uniref:Uncharacterized protein n=1 Tax=Cylicostephanus goldi TaxID=71465 RepID=A0A3P6S6I0_CYLGO|nr:unnamed protein product [Cylicostephanus goldi]
MNSSLSSKGKLMCYRNEVMTRLLMLLVICLLPITLVKLPFFSIVPVLPQLLRRRS